MPERLLSLSDAARELGLSRSRVEALVQSGRLPAEKVGSRWVIDLGQLRAAEHVLYGVRGRPLSERSAWRQIDLLIGGQLRPLDLDVFRRRVRARARHRDFYIHSGLFAEIHSHPATIVSGREVARQAGAPVDDGDEIDAYIRAAALDDLLAFTRGREVRDGANVHLHVVDGWPFPVGDNYVHPWVAWLDLEDRRDRAADALLDHLVGGRIVG